MDEIINKYDFCDKIGIVTEFNERFVVLIIGSIKNLDNIFELLKYDKILTNQSYKDLINHTISTTFSLEIHISKIVERIDVYVNENTDVTPEPGRKNFVSPPWEQLILFVKNIKDKDMFISTYYQTLIKRLMIKSVLSSDDFDKKIIIEENIYDILKKTFGDKITYKIGKIINDAKSSVRQNNLSKNKIVTTITTSFGLWDINQVEGFINNDMCKSISHTQIGKYLMDYSTDYSTNVPDKVLNWFPHFGEVKLTFNNINMTMLPIQCMVLELFCENNTINMEDIIKHPIFTNYTPKFIFDIIGSLVIGKLLQNNSGILTLLLSEQYEQNLITLFFTNSDFSLVWEQRREEEIVHSREEILCTIINHIVKKYTLNKDELFNQCQKENKLFTICNDTFDKSLDKLISMDYIGLNNDTKYIKLFY